MNKSILITLQTLFAIFIVWFIGYFVFGENIGIEFADYEFAKLFPKILTFCAGASIYFLFMLSIKKADKWNYKNILKFAAGIILAIVPFILFKYYTSIGNCQTWEVSRRVVKTLYQSKSSTSETIKAIETICPEMESKKVDTYRVMALTPLFNTISPVDTAKIRENNWKKIN